MVTYIRSDLDFILAQIKIAEAHAAGTPLYGPGGLIPTYNLSWGLRTVDGSNNHLLPGQEQWGAAGVQFPELVDPTFDPAENIPPGFGPPNPTSYNPSNNPGSMVFDSQPRTISNLLVDQTLGNPAAILTALERAGAASPMGDLPAVTAIYAAFKPASDAEYQARVVMQNAVRAFNDDPTNPALITARDNAVAAHDLTVTDLEAARVVRDTALEPFGIEMQGDNVYLPNIAPDEGLSAPFNSWFTLFGQFFDHGLDLVNKGGSGTVFIPLQPDDPLYVEGSQTNFMVLTRATVAPGPDGAFGTADDVRPVNTTTAYVDQNQTYTSHASHQVFLRQYVLNADGDPVATGKLIEGANGGMATWGEVKAQAAAKLGILLTDSDVGSVPLLRTDAYGNFIPAANGMPQLITGVGVDGIPNTEDDIVVVGNILAPIATTGAIRTNSAFLADIAHEAVPVGKIADGDITIGLGNPGNGDTEYDNELLDAHFIAGDGRVNENIGLTAVHHVFHAEHNRLVEHTKDTVLASNDLAFINEWLGTDLADLSSIATQAGRDLLKADIARWDGERLFQAAKFGTEMQYQHLVFEEFARKIQPNINVFLVPDGFDTTINPDIVAEFAHVVYRFGHSMLTESIDRYDANFASDHIGLIEGFLNPLAFDADGTPVAHTLTDDVAAGAIIRGMTRQVGNQIDEFVTTALRNNLLGLPLDLATINLARGRDTGVPSLNEARRSFYQATNEDVLLKPYDSWVDFAGHLKHEASIINFVAAYGTHTLITGQDTLQEKRDAALTIITGVSVGGFDVPTDRLDFLNATGAYAGGTLGGLEKVDLWIGGLAEEIMPFGGMLGSTFNFVFEVQMEKLQNGDRFYYLQRLDGLHLFGEMENNSFAAMIMRNTDATHLPSDVFSTPGLILEVDRINRQFNDLDGDGTLENTDPTGTSLLTPLVLRDNPATAAVEANYLRYTGEDHVLLGGTEGNDTLIASIGDDTLFGDGGNDRLEGGFGNDIINGGDGDDIIKDSGGDDNIKAGKGHDVVHAGPGLDLVMGNDGQDFIFLGTDMGSEVFAGQGNDFIYGNKNAERILGNEGDDWIETGTFDGAPGDNFDEIFAHDGIDGNDVFLGDGGFDEFIGEGGDDIMVGSAGRGKMVGMSGFDWATYKDNTFGVNADLSIPIIFDEAPTLPQNASLDEYESMEGLSGTRFNDVLAGTNDLAADRASLALGGTTGYLGSALDAQGIALINGLQAVLGAGVTSFTAGDIILGGDGSDVIQGNAGDDIIDGDKWLNVRIGIMSGVGANGPTGTEVAGNLDIRSMTSLVTLRLDINGNMVTAPTGGTPTTKTLAAWMFDGKINPGQLQIIREVLTDNTNLGAADPLRNIDTARYQGARSEYAFSATADGQVIVSHAVEDSLDGTDRLRNIERVVFADNSPLNIIVGTPGNDVPLNGTEQDDLILGLAGADTLNGLGGNDILVGGPGGTTTTTATYADNFNDSNFGNSTGTIAWGPDWSESNDGGGSGSPTAGQIRLDDGQNALRFNSGDGAQIQRTVDLSGATAASLAYTVAQNGTNVLDGGADGDSVTVFFSRNGVDFVQVDQINNASVFTPRNIDLSAFGTGPFTASAAVRFVVNTLEGTEFVSIDNLAINFTTVTTNTGVDTLNGGLGDDTYSFSLGDGNDVINEAVNATSGGAADRISILAPSTGVDIDGLPILTIDALNANDSNTAANTGDLVINYTLPTGTQQTITVAGHFTGAVANTGVERINFNGANYAGYALGAADYIISRLDPANRDAGGASLPTSLANNFLVGENGVNDEITGGLGNDLIFGGTGDNDLFGGDGDDLLVGGSGNGDDDFLDGGAGADTMVGLAGNDTYVVDDVLDVVVEAATAGAGTDTVETLMAALSIEFMANVENLSYEGVDADQFVGTGNAGNNIISGGDLADTLSGLGGNDTLNGGLGADTMTGGDGNDTYDVDEVGDVVIETTADAAVGGIDLVESDVDFTLGANVENLDLNGAAIRGTGNILNNVIDGNGENNQLFGAGGNDTLGGEDGDDLLDGGDGNDALNGGDDNDTIIGGAGNDTINVGGGFNTIVYNAPTFGTDIVNSFDADANGGGQDLINVAALGITAANFAARVGIVDLGADTMVTIDGNASTTIRLNGVNGTGNNIININDFTLAAAAPTSTITGTNLANTINGVGATSETINALGGNDIVNANGGNDVVNGGEGADTLNGGDGNDTLSGGAGSNTGAYVDNFGAASYANSDGTIAFAGSWTETNDGTVDPAAGDIQITGGRLRFGEGTDGDEIIQRSINLAGATAASLSFTYEGDDLDAGESVAVEAFNGTTWQLLGTLGGDTNANVNFTAPLSAAHTAIRLRAVGTYEGGENFYVDNFTVNATIPNLNAGVDTVNGDAGDDTVIWNANAAAPTDGRDIVNGGTEGAAGDTFVITGNASAETYTIYTRAAWLAIAGNVAANLNAATEIVVTRDGSNNAAVIAELSEIEEIRINGSDPSGPSGTAGGDNFEIIGDFSTTSLRLNTITIDGSAGDDAIDISALRSAHRLVFKSNGGNDTIIGTLRAQDVIELPNGAKASDYQTTTDANGVTTMTRNGHTITFCRETDDDDNGTPQPVAARSLIGTSAANTLTGAAGDDVILGGGGADIMVGDAGNDILHGEDGNDVITAGDGDDSVNGGEGSDELHGGAGIDMLFGGAGDDRIHGEAGDDFIEGGAGDDQVWGGAGNDTVIAKPNDGSDSYWGGDGADTLDYSAALGNLTVDLGNGFMQRGSVTGSNIGTDTIYGFENFVGGAGHDTVTATTAVNIMDGGAGNDTFRFTSTGAINDDVIYGFQPGDKINFSSIDANSNVAGKQGFVLAAGTTLTAAGQVVVFHEVQDGNEVTVIHGNVDGTGVDFELTLDGKHNLTASDFQGVS